MVGNYSIETNTFLPNRPQLDAGLRLYYDYGKLYASKTFFGQFTSHCINFGWIDKSVSEEAHVSKGWVLIMLHASISLGFSFLVLMFYTWSGRKGLLIIALCTIHVLQNIYMMAWLQGNTKKDLIGWEGYNRFVTVASGGSGEAPDEQSFVKFFYVGCRFSCYSITDITHLDLDRLICPRSQSPINFRCPVLQNCLWSQR